MHDEKLTADGLGSGLGSRAGSPAEMIEDHKIDPGFEEKGAKELQAANVKGNKDVVDILNAKAQRILPVEHEMRTNPGSETEGGWLEAIIGKKQKNLETMKHLENSKRLLVDDANRPTVTTGSALFPHICQILNNATLYADVPVGFLPQGKPCLTPELLPEFARHVEQTVEKILQESIWKSGLQRQVAFRPNWEVDVLERGICLEVAMGNSPGWDAYTREPLIYSLDPKFAYPFIPFEPKTLQQRMLYKIAYTVTVKKCPQCALALVQALAEDHNVYLLVYIDQPVSDSSSKDLRDFVEKTENMAIAPKSFYINTSKDHISNVWLLLQLFFTLSDQIEYEYVINLEEDDYPLKTSDVIYQELQKHGSGNWVYWLAPTDEDDDDTSSKMWHCRDKTGRAAQTTCQYEYTFNVKRTYLLEREFRYRYIAPLGMILHFKTIDYIRSSHLTTKLLLWLEHAPKADLTFFPTFLASSPMVANTYRDNKRLTAWRNDGNPLIWTDAETLKLDRYAAEFMFLQHLTPHPLDGLRHKIDSLRKNAKPSESIVRIYDFRTGIVPYYHKRRR